MTSLNYYFVRHLPWGIRQILPLPLVFVSLLTFCSLSLRPLSFLHLTFFLCLLEATASLFTLIWRVGCLLSQMGNTIPDPCPSVLVLKWGATVVPGDTEWLTGRLAKPKKSRGILVGNTGWEEMRRKRQLVIQFLGTKEKNKVLLSSLTLGWVETGLETWRFGKVWEVTMQCVEKLRWEPIPGLSGGGLGGTRRGQRSKWSDLTWL